MFSILEFINYENLKIIERQEEATVKRIKLEYDDIGSSAREYLGVWETIVNKENRKYDAKMLRQAIRQGNKYFIEVFNKLNFKSI